LFLASHSPHCLRFSLFLGQQLTELMLGDSKNGVLVPHILLPFPASFLLESACNLGLLGVPSHNGIQDTPPGHQSCQGGAFLEAPVLLWLDYSWTRRTGRVRRTCINAGSRCDPSCNLGYQFSWHIDRLYRCRSCQLLECRAHVASSALVLDLLSFFIFM
jgi:hypothetical protein